MKIPSSNLRRTCCAQKLFLTFRTIFVHSMFSPCSAKRRTSDKDLPVTNEWVKFQLLMVSQFQVLVFFAIAEYGLLLHTKSHRSKTYEISPQQPNDKHGCIKIGKKKFSMPLLDKIAIVVLPLLFIMFNVIYWSVYTTWIPYARHHKPLLIWSRSRL